MRVAKSGKEKNLGELVDRLFEFKKDDVEARARARERLVSANPHLARFERLPDGLPIVVPEVEGIEPIKDKEAFLPLFAELAGQVKQAVTALSERSKQIDESNRTETRKVLRQLKTKKIKTLLGDEPEVQQKLGEVTTELQTRAKDSEALQKFQTAALVEIAGDLNGLSKLATNLAARVVATQRLTGPSVKPAANEEGVDADRGPKKDNTRKK